MRIFKYIILLVLLLPLGSQAAEILTVSNISVTNYPNVTADVFVSDSLGNIIYKYDKSAFIAKENGTNIDIQSYKCPVPGVPFILSSVLTIDISSSMKGKGRELARAGAGEWIKLQTANQFECAISTFNHANYINRDFSSDKTKLLASLQDINPDGGTSFNAAFTADPAGALIIAARGKNKRVVIMISDGESVGNEEVIVQNAKAIGAEIYCVTLQQKAPQILKNISERTGGLCWDNVNDLEQIRNIYRSILFISKNIEPCRLVFNSQTCSERNLLELTLLPAGKTVAKDFAIAANNLPKISFSGSNVIEFGFIPLTFSISKPIEIRADNADILIKDIDFQTPRFSIKDWGGAAPPFTLKKDASRTLTIEYTALDSIYEVCNFSMIHGNCAPTYFYAIGGIKDTNSIENVMKITEPNGGEAYRIGYDSLFKWKGISPNDTVRFEVSRNGVDWTTLSSNAVNFSGKWTTPLIASDTYKARISTTKSTDDYSKILTFNPNTNPVDALAFNPTGSQIVVAAGSATSIYSTTDAALIRNIDNNTNDTKELAWASQYDFICRAGATDYLLFWHTTNTDAVIGFRQDLQIMSRLALNPVNNTIAGSARSGLLYIWNFPDTKAIDTINTGANEVTDISWAPNGSIFAVATSDGQVQIYNSANDSLLTVLKDTTQSVPSVSWTNSGKYIALAYGKTVEIWNYEILTLIRSLNFANNITKIKFSNNYNTLTIAHDNTLNIYSYINGNVTDTFVVNSRINDFDISYDGSKIALGLADSRVLVFNRSDLPFTRKISKTAISDTYWSIKAPNFSMNKINFGDIYLGDVQDSLFEKCIQNNSGISYPIDSLKIIGNEDIFSFNNLKHYTLADKQQIDLVLRLNATRLGTYTSRMVLYCSGYQFETTITGKIIPPDLVVLSDLVDLGKLPVGDTLKINKYMVFNNSTQSAIIDSLKNIGPAYSSFTTDNLKNVSIPPNDSIKMNLVFVPKESGRLSSSFRLVYDSRESSKQINLFGEGIAPIVKMTDTVIIRKLFCKNSTFTDSIPFYNIGNYVLKIKDLTSDSPALNNLSSTTNSINPDDSAYVKFSIEYPKPGLYSSSLYIFTNPDFRNSSIDSITIITILDSSSIEIQPKTISFNISNTDEKQTQTLKIKNTGSVELNFADYPENALFKVIEINPRKILPDSIAQARVEFQGSATEGIFIDSLAFDDACNSSHYLFLSANVGTGQAIITCPDNLILTKPTCSNTEVDTTIYIHNTGLGNLLINSAAITGNDASLFSLSSINNKIVSPNDSIALNIKYTPVLGGTHTALITIHSNSTTPSHTITLNAEWKNFAFEVILDSLHFADIIEGESSEIKFDLINTGVMPISWQIPTIATSDFSVVSITPMYLLPGKASEITVSFKGGKSDSLYSSSISILDSCMNETKVKLTALPHGFAEIVLKVADKQASVNSKTTMPIYIQQKNATSFNSIDSIAGKLLFNSRTALYLGNQKVKYSENNTGEIKYRINFRQLTNDTLAAPEFLVLLPDTAKSLFKFETEKVYANRQVSILDLPGELSLIDSLDLIQNNDTAGIITIYPHPVRKNAKAELMIIEKGRHIVQIIDLLGGTIKTIFDDEIAPGTKKINFNVEKLPIGTYFLILKTPSSIFSKKFIILR